MSRKKSINGFKVQTKELIIKNTGEKGKWYK